MSRKIIITVCTVAGFVLLVMIVGGLGLFRRSERSPLKAATKSGFTEDFFILPESVTRYDLQGGRAIVVRYGVRNRAGKATVLNPASEVYLIDENEMRIAGEFSHNVCKMEPGDRVAVYFTFKNVAATSTRFTFLATFGGLDIEYHFGLEEIEGPVP